MESTALNLIAIGVFAITLTCLLSPILNISPTIPAGITFVILSLATIDTLTWQNKGTNILLDLLSPKEHRQRVVTHEAGHFLVAKCLGIPITGYTLTAWEAFKSGQPGVGGVRFDSQMILDKIASSKDNSLILERFCIVLMAGIAAETQVYGSALGGAEDRQNLRQILKLAGVTPSMYLQQERFALLQATNILQENQSAYQALIEAMTRRASVEECYQVISQLATTNGN